MSSLRPVSRRRAREPSDLVTITEAAKLLGVSVPTLRRWDNNGKFRARRHPINGYRMYTRADVMRLRDKIVGDRPV